MKWIAQEGRGPVTGNHIHIPIPISMPIPNSNCTASSRCQVPIHIGAPRTRKYLTCLFVHANSMASAAFSAPASNSGLELELRGYGNGAAMLGSSGLLAGSFIWVW